MQSFQHSGGHLINVSSYCSEADGGNMMNVLSRQGKGFGFCFVGHGEPLKDPDRAWG